jgi:hypothetical protein
METSAPSSVNLCMKRLRPPIIASLLVLSIAACEKRDPVADEANAVAPSPITNDSAGAVAGAPPPVNANAEDGGVISPAIQGRWGLTPADCTPNRSDAKGLLVISANELKFYESRGTPGTSIESDHTGISGNFNFTGEGQSWSKYVSLKLQHGSLVRTERSPMASYTYARCD